MNQPAKMSSSLCKSPSLANAKKICHLSVRWNGYINLPICFLILTACTPKSSNIGTSTPPSDGASNTIKNSQSPIDLTSIPKLIDEDMVVELVRDMLSTNSAWSGTGISYRVTTNGEGFHVLVIKDDLTVGSHRSNVLDKHGKVIRNTGGL